MAVEVFNRREIKYRIGNGVFLELAESLAGFIAADAHCCERFTYPVASIYYDTPDCHLIRTSTSGCDFREKLRLRSYGTPDRDSVVYAEIKRKVFGVTVKRRSALTLDEAGEFFSTGTVPDVMPHMNGQVLREISCMLNSRAIAPAVYISYERRAYGLENEPLRITFDTDVRTRRHDLSLGTQGGDALLGEGEWLMEIKTAQAVPIWLARLVSGLGLRPVSFSKYGEEYKNTLPALRALPAASPRRAAPAMSPQHRPLAAMNVPGGE